MEKIEDDEVVMTPVIIKKPTRQDAMRQSSNLKDLFKSSGLKIEDPDMVKIEEVVGGVPMIGDGGGTPKSLRKETPMKSNEEIKVGGGGMTVQEKENEMQAQMEPSIKSIKTDSQFDDFV